MPHRDLDAADAWVAAWSDGIEDRAVRAQEMATQVGRLSATATAAGGLIEVRVDNSGALTDLHLHDHLTGRPASELERDILRAVRAAQERLVEQVATIVDTTIGGDTETGRAVLDSYHRRFPPPRDGHGDR